MRNGCPRLEYNGLMRCFGLEHAAESDEAFLVIAHRKFVNADTARGSVDEGDVALLGVYFLDEAHVAHSLAHAGRLEEDEVAGLQFRQFLYLCTLCPLHDSATAQLDVLLAVDEAGEARAVERVRARGAVAIARADIFHGVIDQLAALVIFLFFGGFLGQRLGQHGREEGKGEYNDGQDSFDGHSGKSNRFVGAC